MQPFVWKASKGTFLERNKQQNHSNEKQKETRKKKRVRRRKRGEEKKSNRCTLSFYNSYFGDSYFGPSGDNVFKKRSRYSTHPMNGMPGNIPLLINAFSNWRRWSFATRTCKTLQMMKTCRTLFYWDISVLKTLPISSSGEI